LPVDDGGGAVGLKDVLSVVDRHATAIGEEAIIGRYADPAQLEGVLDEVIGVNLEEEMGGDLGGE